ncbi:MAG: ABC transporter permease, partial [Kordiimonas sp.]
MIGHTIGVSLRQILRRPFLPIMNLVGLACGIAVTLIILLYAYVETHFDDWVTDQENLYRIEGQYKGSWSSYYHLYVVNALGPAIADFPEVKNVVRLIGNHWLVKKDDFVNYDTVFLAEDGFLDIFPLQFVKGSTQSPFPTKNSVIISEAAALQYWGQEDPVGQTLTLNEAYDFTVSAVFKEVGPRTDYPFKFVVPFQDVLVHEPNSWDVYDSETFVRLNAGASTESLYERIAQLVDEHRPLHKQTDHVMRERFHYFLQPFADLHLGSQGRTEANTIGNYAKIYGFIAIAGLVLMISVFNYIGLATARDLEREREFCLRKISGAGFRQILHHTVAESFLLTWLAAMLGWVITEAVMPYVGAFLDADYSLLE